jgi:hypothetical protein
MSQFLVVPSAIPPSSEEMIAKVRRLEDEVRQAPQIEFVTEHVFHAGMYARTVRIGPNVVFTSALIKCATILIIHGDLLVLAGDEMVRMNGYCVLPAEAGRKQVYITGSDVELTMIFPSGAKTVEEAEEQFTDEAENLLSRTNENDIVMTSCLESPQLPRS